MGASYDSLVYRGIDAMSNDSLSKAENCFREAMRQEPTNAANVLLFRYLGQIQERQGREQEALESYTAGVNLSPKNLDLRLDRAALLFRMGDDQRALMDYTDALDIQPENIEALGMRAYIYAEQHNYKKARDDYEALLSIDPMNERARIGLILVNDRDSRSVEARRQIDALIEMHPDHAVLYAIRGGIEQRHRQYEMSLADLSRAIELDPKNADYYVSRATLYLEMGKRKLARQDAQEAVRLGADPKEMASMLKKD